ncbi:MAG: hypothetical protein RL607_1706 [Bacteroidota bacterium]|jgi:hypothetical protein
MKHFLYTLLGCLFITVAWAQKKQLKSEVTVYFDTNSHQLKTHQKQQLDSLFTYPFESDLAHEFHIDGYTDETGPLAFNQWLSQQRACTVAAYLQTKGVAENRCYVNGNGICMFKEANNLQRTVHVEHRRIRGCGLQLEKKDTIAFAPPYFKNISAYFDTKSRIRDRVFALDQKDSIIKTAGMYLFESDPERLNTLDPNTMVRFCFPIPKDKKFDPNMKIWRLVLNDKGEKRWEETTIPVQYNTASNCYEGFMNCIYLKGERGINIDKRAPDETKIEVAFYKTVDCYDVALTDAEFEAIIVKRNVQRYNFLGFTNRETGYFKGNFKKNGTNHELSFPLTSCVQTIAKDGSVLYFLTEKSHFWVDGKEYNGPRSFWKRIGDWFRKKENPF